MKRILLSIVVLLVLLCGIAVAEEKSVIAQGDCGASGSNLTWTLDSEGTLTISGTGWMADYDLDDGFLAPWILDSESIEAVVIEAGVRNIGEWAFCDCYNLSSIDIPSSVTSIGNSAFSWCESLSSITIPASVTSIHEDAFSIYQSKKLVIIAPENSFAYGWARDHFLLPENKIFKNGFIFLLKNGKASVLGYEGENTDVIIPSQTSGYPVTKIDAYAFAYCYDLTSVAIPAGITNIGDYAFYMCENLSSTVLPESVTSIGDHAFEDCIILSSINIPSGVTSIGESAFYMCESLTSIVIPSGVTRIGNYTFSRCSSLRSVMIPVGVTSIGDNAFSDCSSLTSISIPASVTSIGRVAFMWCSSLSSIAIPTGVTSIGDYTFSWCESLTSVTIPSGVTSIGSSAFGSCHNLSSIAIPEGVTSIGPCAFEFCGSLRSIGIPASVTSIAWGTFTNCNSLERIIFRGRSKPSMSSDTIPTSATICCYRGSEVDNWAMGKGYTVEYFDGHVHTLVTDPAVPATHVTTGRTEGSHCSVCGEILVAQQIIPVVEVKKLVLPAGLKAIESEAFASDSIVCVVLPNGCTAIGAGAFRNCAQLRFVEIPESVTSIDGSAFTGCGDALIIVTASGSAAEDFANRNGITCVTR